MNSSTKKFTVTEATCGHCVATIEGTLNKNPNVEQAKMELADKTLTVTGAISQEEVISELKKVGFDALVK